VSPLPVAMLFETTPAGSSVGKESLPMSIGMLVERHLAASCKLSEPPPPALDGLVERREPEPPAAETTGPTVAVEPAAPRPQTPPDDRYGLLADRILDQLTPTRPAVLMFTSPDDGHGKTTTLRALAPKLAERVSGEVLLVDASLGTPDLAEQFGVPAVAGLSEVLEGRMAWSDAVCPTGVEHLSLLPAGRRDVPGETAAEKWDLGGLLRHLVHHYGLILVDTASLVHADAAFAAQSCEGTYLIVRLDRTPRRLAREAVRAIEQGHGRLLGCIAIE
jgi:Mrp family chromosome partitioning ATPase